MLKFVVIIFIANEFLLRLRVTYNSLELPAFFFLFFYRLYRDFRIENRYSSF